MPIAYFDPETLVVHHTISYHDASYDPTLNGDHFVVHDAIIPHERARIRLGPNGHEISEKLDMPTTLAVARIILGSSAVFSPTLESASIAVNGLAIGTMDDSGHLEIEPSSTGFYKIRFSLDGYMDGEFDLEVVGRP